MAGSYLSQSLACQTQYLFTTNLYVKHILIFFVIYFSINFTSQDKLLVNPIINIIRALFIWILFHLYSRMNIIPSLIVLFLLMISYVINKYINYYEFILDKLHDNDKKYYTKLIDILDNTSKYISYLCVIITIIGFLIYYNQKKSEFKNRFSMQKFIFGLHICKSLKNNKF